MPDPTTVTLCFFSCEAWPVIAALLDERVGGEAETEGALAEEGPSKVEISRFSRRVAVAAAGEAFESIDWPHDRRGTLSGTCARTSRSLTLRVDTRA